MVLSWNTLRGLPRLRTYKIDRYKWAIPANPVHSA